MVGKKFLIKGEKFDNLNYYFIDYKMSSSDLCIRSEDCNVVAGLYNIILKEKIKIIKIIASKYDIPYEELYQKYCVDNDSFGDYTVAKYLAF